MKRVDVVWGAALIVLLLIGYGLVPTPSVRAPVDTFSEQAAGKKAFYLVTESLLDDVARSSGALIPDDELADTLVMLGPARYPDRAQWQTLFDWVSQGRALVFAARWQDPAVELEPFGIEVVPRETASTHEGEGDGDVDDDEERSERVETELVDTTDSPFEWRSLGEIRTTATDATVELSVDGSPQVMWRPIGDGAVIVVASDYVFTNRSLTDEERGLIAFRILETAAPAGPVYFDETMNAAGAPRVVGVLLEAPFRLITLQLVVVVFLFGWMASRRFGPLVVAESGSRRSLVEHAEALGNWHFKVGSGGTLLTSYLEFYRRELGLRHAGGATLERDPAAPRGREREMDRMLVAAKSADLSRDGVAEAVKFLARLRESGRSE